MKNVITLDSLYRRVCGWITSNIVENSVPTDKMQRFMEYAQSTVDMRKRGTNASNVIHILICRWVFLQCTEVGSNDMQVIQNAIQTGMELHIQILGSQQACLFLAIPTLHFLLEKVWKFCSN